MDHHLLLKFGAALLFAAILVRAGGRLHLPSIPFLIVIGALIGPHSPGPVLVHEPEAIYLLAVLGLVFLLFHLGLEFSVQDLQRGGKRLLAAGGSYVALNVGAGLAFGFALDWGWREAVIIAGMIGTSSTAIVTKLLVELGRLGNRETGMILASSSSRTCSWRPTWPSCSRCCWARRERGRRSPRSSSRSAC